MSARIYGLFELTRKTVEFMVFDFTQCSRTTLQSIVGVAVLVMLAVASPAQSAYISEAAPGSQSNPGLQNNLDAGITEIELDIDALKRSATLVPEIAGPATEGSSGPLRLNKPVNLEEVCAKTAAFASSFVAATRGPESYSSRQKSGGANNPDRGSKSESPVMNPGPKPIDFGSTIYYKNKTEFGLDVGWLPINIPFVFDFLLGDGYNKTPLNYTLVPIIASLRWQLDDVGGPWIFRGNWDLQTSLGIVPTPRGPETHYFAWIMGIRRNFVPRRGKIDPYFDFRLGLGGINAKEPLGVLFAQGQNFTFTINMGSGVRYNFNQRYSISAGMNYMHISNAYLSEPAFSDYGINVYGPMVGVEYAIGQTSSCLRIRGAGARPVNGTATCARAAGE